MKRSLRRLASSGTAGGGNHGSPPPGSKASGGNYGSPPLAERSGNHGSPLRKAPRSNYDSDVGRGNYGSPRGGGNYGSPSLPPARWKWCSAPGAVQEVWANEGVEDASDLASFYTCAEEVRHSLSAKGYDPGMVEGGFIAWLGAPRVVRVGCNYGSHPTAKAVTPGGATTVRIPGGQSPRPVLLPFLGDQGQLRFALRLRGRYGQRPHAWP